MQPAEEGVSPVNPTRPEPAELALASERNALLARIEGWLEIPMLVLGAVWLGLLVVELVWGLTPLLEVLGTVIWIVFIVDFALAFTLAPKKLAYLQGNWLTAVSLLVPALRMFRFFRVLRFARATRGFRLLEIVGSMNRGLRALGESMSRRGLGYMAALTLLVTLAGSAGMYAFENQSGPGRGFDTYGAALWWTLMLMTTMGSEFWPRSAEGRVLCGLLALYAFGVFGYVTAALASFFVGRDSSAQHDRAASAAQVQALSDQVEALRAEMGRLASELARRP